MNAPLTIVINAATNGSMRSGIWGVLLTTDGAIRDVSKISDVIFPVWARGTCV
jgi:regulator of RNase E activity RraA